MGECPCSRLCATFSHEVNPSIGELACTAAFVIEDEHWSVGGRVDIHLGILRLREYVPGSKYMVGVLLYVREVGRMDSYVRIRTNYFWFIDENTANLFDKSAA